MPRRRVLSLIAGILVILGLIRLGFGPGPTPEHPTGVAGKPTAFTVDAPRPTPASDIPGEPWAEAGGTGERRDLLARLAYAQAWDGPLPTEQAAFRAWTLRYLQAPSPAARLGLLAEGVQRAQARRPSMLALIASDPQRALALTVPAQIRQRLPAVVLAALEARVAGRGELSLLAAVPAPDEPNPGPALRRIAYLDGVTRTAFTYGRREEQLTKENTFLHGIAMDDRMAVHESPLRLLEPAEEPADPLPPTCADCGTPVDTDPTPQAVAGEALDRVALAGKTWRLHGGEEEILALEQRLVLAEDQAQPRLSESVRVGLAASTGETGYTLPATAADAPTAHTVGLKPVLVLRVDFSDVPGEVVSQITAQAVVGDLSATFLDAVSYGQTSLAATVSATVYRLPQTAAAYALANNTAGLHADARAAASADYTLAQYERIIVAFPSIGSSRIPGSQITFGGLASTGGTNVWINGAASFAYTTISHELGHTYGLPHANLWKVADGNPQSPAGTTLEYGDPFDMMGSTTVTGVSRNNRHHFGPWFKNRLGWLPDEAVSRVGESGVYRIYRFDSRAARRDRPLALRVFRDGVRWYWVGLRQNFSGFTAGGRGVDHVGLQQSSAKPAPRPGHRGGVRQ